MKNYTYIIYFSALNPWDRSVDRCLQLQDAMTRAVIDGLHQLIHATLPIPFLKKKQERFRS